MSRVVRKRDYYLCENKDADQLRSNCEADQRLCFRYLDSTILALPTENFMLLAILLGCTDRFMSDLVGNPENRFSCVAAPIRYHVQLKPRVNMIYTFFFSQKHLLLILARKWMRTMFLVFTHNPSHTVTRHVSKRQVTLQLHSNTPHAIY